jgi:S-adenosylmethionine/arginine decarboxylase-like enzyme
VIYLTHQHSLLKIHTDKFFKSEEEMNDFLRRLVKHLKMDIILEPRSAYCGQPGNTGLTGQVGLVTSHACIHSWDEYNYHEMDVYSCKAYDIIELLSFVRVELKPWAIDYLDFDRETLERKRVEF